MIELNRIQLTSQTPSHVEITKMLSTSQPERLLVPKIDFCREDYYTNLRQVSIDVKYTRDQHLGFKKDFSSKTNNTLDAKNKLSIIENLYGFAH